MKEIIYITSIYMGTLIGAGFATGKEIQQFFFEPFGIAVAAFFFTVINLRLFTYINKNNIYTYDKLLENKCEKLKPYIKVISLTFALLSYGIMCSGAGEALGFKWGGILFSLFCCFVFLFELKGITFISMLATPLIIVGISLIFSAKVSVFADISVSSVKYCAYNTLCCLPVIPSLNHYMKNMKSAVISALVCSSVTGLLIFMVYYSLPGYICNLPLLETATALNMKYFYYPSLLLAMLTTSVSSGYGYLCCFEKRKYIHIATLFVVSVIMQSIDFGVLVKYIFNFFGVISVVILYFLLKKS